MTMCQVSFLDARDSRRCGQYLGREIPCLGLAAGAGQAQATKESLSLGSQSSVAKSEEFPSPGHLRSSFLMGVH